MGRDSTVRPPPQRRGCRPAPTDAGPAHRETDAFTAPGTTLKKDWLKALDAATSIDEVMRAVEDFVESRSDVYWTGVPAELRRPAIATEAHLERWHHALVQAISSMPSPGSPMQELAVFSLRAAVRIHQIRLQDERTRPSNEGGLETAGAPARRQRR